MKAKTIILISFIVIFFVNILFAQSERKKVQEANKLFRAEQYEEALNLYRDAELDNPESPSIHYNIGNSLYKQGRFEEAFQEFDKVLTAKDSDLHFRSYYNMGNTLYRMNKLPESILSYTKALQINPDDFQSKYNLEFVRNKLKEQLNNQDQSQGAQQQQQESQQEQQSGQESRQEQKEQQNEEEMAQQQEPQNEQEMTPEEAERILNALQNEEKDLLRQRKAKTNSKTRVKKDW